MKKYEFNLKEDSFLALFLRKHLINKLASHTPNWITPNFITLIAFVTANITILIILYLDRSPLSCFFIVLTIALFLFLGGLDGCLARFQNKVSALGEFYNHMTNIYMLGILSYALFFCFNFSNTLVATIISIYQTVYQASIFGRYKQTGVLVYGKIGPLEEIISLMALIFLGIFIHPDFCFISPIFLNLTVLELFMLSTFLIHGCFMFAKLLCYPSHHKHFYTYIGSATILIFALPNWDMLQSALFMLPFNIDFSARLLRSHLLDEPYPKPDLITPLAVVILSILSTEKIIYMGIPISYLWAKVFVFYFYTAAHLTRESKPASEEV